MSAIYTKLSRVAKNFDSVNMMSNLRNVLEAGLLFDWIIDVNRIQFADIGMITVGLHLNFYVVQSCSLDRSICRLMTDVLFLDIVINNKI